MPGTVVRDADAPDLLSALDLADEGAAQNGTAWECLWPGLIQFVLDIASVTGTTPTMTILVQGSENSDFSTENVVQLGDFSVGDEADNTTFAFTTYVDSKYVRAVADVSGTTVVYTATLTPVLPHDRRVRGTHPTSDTLA
jgi:hypothetical protein